MRSHPHFIWTDLFRQKKTANSTVLEALKENILFCTLSSRELNYLSTMVYERVYQADEPIFDQNDRGFGMYVIARGSVAIKSLVSGGDVMVTTLTQGSFFGELSLIEQDNVRSASSVALERSILIGFFKPDLMEVLERKPSMGVKILLQLSIVLGKRLVETTDRIAVQMQQQVQNNVTPIQAAAAPEKIA